VTLRSRPPNRRCISPDLHQDHLHELYSNKGSQLSRYRDQMGAIGVFGGLFTPLKATSKYPKSYEYETAIRAGIIHMHIHFEGAVWVGIVVTPTVQHDPVMVG